MHEIRTASADDDHTIVELLLVAFADLYVATGLQMTPEREAYLSDQASRRAFSTTFICEADGKAVGTVTVVPPSGQSAAWVPGAWELRLLAVEPGSQGAGIARALVSAAEAMATAAGAETMCLHARKGISSQARLYPSCGYARDDAGDRVGPVVQEGYRKRLSAIAAS